MFSFFICPAVCNSKCGPKGGDKDDVADVSFIRKTNCDKGIAGGHPTIPSQEGSWTPEASANAQLETRKSAMLPNGLSGDFLRKVELFKTLSQEDCVGLAEAFTSRYFDIGQVVITEGDIGTEFFVIRGGSAAVTSNGRQLAKLEAGDCFGERALLSNMPRMATVTATSPLLTVVLTRERFQEMGMHDKVHVQVRKAIGGGNVDETGSPEPTPKTPEETNLIIEALRTNKNLNTMVKLTDAMLSALADSAWKECVEQGERLIEDGDIEKADRFYIVQDGRFAIFPGGEANRTQSAEAESAMTTGEAQSRETVIMVSSGASFGELALLYQAPRNATVQATSRSTVWAIGRKALKKLLASASEEEEKQQARYLDSVPMFDSLLPEEKVQISHALQENSFEKDDIVIQQGDVGDTFYVLVAGEVEVIQDNKVQTSLVAQPEEKVCHAFGQRALLENEPRSATVKVISPTATILSLDQECFKSYLEPLISKLSLSPTTDKKVAAPKGGPQRKPVKVKTIRQLVEEQKKSRPPGSIKKKELKRIGFLGFGGTGTVELVEHSQTQKMYALKTMSKGHIVQAGMKENIMHEKDLFMIISSPFVVTMYEAYNLSQSLFFLFEAALGGDLHSWFNRKGLFGCEKHVKFYLASTMFAFKYLHSRRIVYRDTKPENMLLNGEGRLKLSDFDCAKFLVGKTMTTCGTPDYLAPEMLYMSGHSFPVDWWGVGVLAFELMAGFAPFTAPAPMDIYAKIRRGIEQVKLPSQCQGDFHVMLQHLLVATPPERLPTRPNGFKKTQELLWWAGFDWKAAEMGSDEAPLKPPVKSRIEEIKRAKVHADDLPPCIVYEDDFSGWDKGFATA